MAQAPSIGSISPASTVNGVLETDADVLTLYGVATASSTVGVYSGTTLLGTATADSSGDWFFTTSALADGTYNFTATDTDSTGTSAASTAFAITVDTAAVTPMISGDVITGTDQVLMTGTAAAKSVVKIYDGTTLLGTATTNGIGEWDFATSALSGGVHALTATARDTSGAISAASQPYNVTIGTPVSGSTGTTVVVSNAAQLTAAIAGASAGTVILLAGGVDYGTITINGSQVPITLKAADYTNPPIFDQLLVKNAANITLDGIKFATQNLPFWDALEITNSQAVTVQNSVFTGGNAGFDNLYGVNVSGSTNVAFNNNVFENLTKAGVFLNDQGLTITGNIITNIRSDGFDFDTVSNVNIGYNQFSNFYPALADHADDLQFMTVGATTASANINIHDNVMMNGGSFGTAAGQAQGIFLGNEAGIAYQNVVIQNNKIYGTYANGISISDASGVQVINNTAVAANAAGTLVHITVTGSSNVTATSNVSNVFDVESNTGGNVSANQANTLTIQSNTNITTSNNSQVPVFFTSTVLPTGPLVLSVVESPATGDLNAGMSVALTLNMTENVTVAGGAPTLTLNDGGVATYTGGTGSSALTFTYTAAAGQNVGSLAATAVNLNGATVQDANGDAANFSLSGLTQLGPQINTSGLPSVVTISSWSQDTSLVSGENISSRNVLTLIGAADPNTTVTVYDGTTVLGTTTTNGTGLWTYTTPTLTDGAHSLTATDTNAGKTSPSSAALAVTIITQPPAAPVISSFSPDGGVIGDGITNATVLTLTGTAAANDYVIVYNGSTELGSTTADAEGIWTITTGSLSSGVQSFTAKAMDAAGNVGALSSATAVTIDVQTPTATKVVATPGSGAEHAGNTITFTLTWSEAMLVTGTPTLSLNDGGTATYTGGSGTNALTFRYTVNAGDTTVSALAITQVNLPTGASLTDVAGNTANLAGAAATFSGLQIVAPSNPTVLSVAESPASGHLNVGNTVTLTLAMSEVANVNTAGGSPTLTLNDGGTATYVSGSGSSSLVFSYTVFTGQNVAALAATVVNLNGATVTDGSGNAANFSLSGLTQTGPQIATTGIVVSGSNSPWIVSNGQNDNGDSIVNGGTEIVSSGGTTTSGTVSAGGILEVLSGGTVSGVTASSGGTLELLSGASDPALTVLSGGTLEIGAGYTEIGYAVSNGVNLDVTSGGAVSGTTVSSGGALNVSSGGIATGTTVSSGGHEFVLHGGDTSGTRVYAGGTETISSGGIDSGTTLIGGTEYVMSGGVDPSTVVSSGGTDVVYGTTTGVTVLSAGNLVVSLGGASSGTLVSAGGTETVSSGGVDTGTAVNGGTEVVSAGGMASSTALSGGFQYVYGSASATAVLNGAIQDILAGGAASGTTVSSGGFEYDNGTASGTTVNGGTEYVFNGGAATGTILNGGTEDVFGGGTASGTTIKGGNEFVFAGGSASRTTVSGGVQYVYGSASAAAVLNGAIQDILAGGAASGTTLSSGGFEYDNGTASGTTVNGGTEYVFNGGAATGTILNGGTEDVFGGGTASGTTIKGGNEFVFAGGSASRTTVSGGVQYVYGSASAAAVLNGAIQDILAGGAASGTTLSSGGFEYDNGTASGTTVNGGTEYVFNGGTASGTTVDGGNEFVFAGGLASRTTVSGGAQYVYGSTSATAVLSGAIQDILAGGAARGTTLSSGGFEYDNGTASGTTVDSGTEFIFNGGTASGTIITSGNESVFAGGSAKGTTVLSGGTVSVLSGGTADGSTISGGGYEEVFSGGLINGATISGGTLELQNGANGAGTFNFASGGMLTLDGTGTYNMLVAGFTSATAEMDLTSINYAGATVSFAEANNNTSGTLTIANGASSASVLLLGNYVAGAASFTLEKDSGGGTIVFDPPVVAGTNPNGLATPHHS